MHFLPGEGRIRGERTTLTPQLAATKTRVLVVDDSESVCKLLAHVINSDPEMECVGTVTRPTQVESQILALRPDVMTLDIHMPEIDGVTLLKRILLTHPLPVVMVSALSLEEGGTVLEALEAGAVDYIKKQTSGKQEFVAVPTEGMNPQFLIIHKLRKDTS